MHLPCQRTPLAMLRHDYETLLILVPLPAFVSFQHQFYFDLQVPKIELHHHPDHVSDFLIPKIVKIKIPQKIVSSQNCSHSICVSPRIPCLF